MIAIIAYGSILIRELSSAVYVGMVVVVSVIHIDTILTLCVWMCVLLLLLHMVRDTINHSGM